MSADQILASLGIEVGVASVPTVDASSNEAPLDTYPTGVVSTLAVFTAIPWFLLGYGTYRLRRVLAQYLRDNFEYFLTPRTELNFRLNYELLVRGEITSTVVLETRPLPEPMVLEEIPATRGMITAEDELSEVVVR